MKVLNELKRTLERAFENSGRARVREYLLRQDDRTLADSGFSRELLERGITAWPWRADGAETGSAEWSRSASPRFASTVSTPATPFSTPGGQAIIEGSGRADRQAA